MSLLMKVRYASHKPLLRSMSGLYCSLGHALSKAATSDATNLVSCLELSSTSGFSTKRTDRAYWSVSPTCCLVTSAPLTSLGVGRAIAPTDGARMAGDAMFFRTLFLDWDGDWMGVCMAMFWV